MLWDIFQKAEHHLQNQDNVWHPRLTVTYLLRRVTGSRKTRERFLTENTILLRRVHERIYLTAFPQFDVIWGFCRDHFICLNPKFPWQWENYKKWLVLIVYWRIHNQHFLVYIRRYVLAYWPILWALCSPQVKGSKQWKPPTTLA